MFSFIFQCEACHAPQQARSEDKGAERADSQSSRAAGHVHVQVVPFTGMRRRKEGKF